MLRKEVSYIPAYMLEQIVIVFHVVDEELIYNTKGMSDVFVVTRREKKNVKDLELLPPGDRVTFTRPLGFLGSPKKIRVLSTMSLALRLFLPAQGDPQRADWAAVGQAGWLHHHDVRRGLVGYRQEPLRRRAREERRAAEDPVRLGRGVHGLARARNGGHGRLMFETPAELELIVKVLGVGCLGIMNRTKLRASGVAEQRHAMRAIGFHHDAHHQRAVVPATPGLGPFRSLRARGQRRGRGRGRTPSQEARVCSTRGAVHVEPTVVGRLAVRPSLLVVHDAPRSSELAAGFKITASFFAWF